MMATVTIRDLKEETKTALKARARTHGRSMEAEARSILDEVLLPSNQPPRYGWFEWWRAQYDDWDDLPELKLPAREIEESTVDFG